MAEEVAAKLAGEAVIGCVNQVKHHFRYLSQYHDNMKKLEADVKNLEKQVVSVRDEVFLADSNAQTIEEGVTAWLTEVTDMKEDAKIILEMKASVGNGCWKGWCVNMRPRYRLSKKAMKKSVDLVTFIAEGAFDTVARPKRHLGFVTSQIQRTTDADNIQGAEISAAAQDPATKEEVIASAMSAAGVIECLESRTILLNDVMEAVRDPQIRMVRICGMGGVGKTTLAEQVEKMARKERLFHDIAMVEVNQNPDIKLLQLHIAQALGLTITEDDVSARARWLGKRLSGQNSEVANVQNSEAPNKKILLILDNVWKRIHLEKAGIPLQDGNGCCKILLTSRYDDICKGVMHEKEFSVEVLSYQEALTLFHQSLSNNGGYYDETISQDLVKECGGLPIALATIGGAVKNKTEQEWKNALRKLKKSDLRKEYDVVFKCLEISYDFLEDEKIKKFFRLCCLFGKGLDVSIEELTRYGTALYLFSDPEYLCDAREEAFSYVQTLMRANLFLRSDGAECLKVHDIVWDFCVSASSSDLFLVHHSSALMKLPRKDSYKDFASISLLCSKLFQVPDSLSFSNLKLLQLFGAEDACYVESFEKIFKEIRGLCVLEIVNMTIPSTLMSFQQLSHLRLLSLTECFFSGSDVSMIGQLSNLEILSFAHSDIKELPEEIKNLKSLRLLDLTMCQSCVIAPRILSELTSLEELYLRMVPLLDSKESESVFVDIASMSTLVAISIKIPEDRVQLMNSLCKNLKKFNIIVNAEKKMWYEDLSENTLDICCDPSVLLHHGLTVLLQKATIMDLRITQLKTLQPLNDSETLDFSELKNLRLEFCNDLVCLVNTMGDLEHNFVAPFRNLKVLNVYWCHRLEHVLTVSAAKGLLMLETIKVEFCSSLKVIFFKERNDEGNIELPRLTNFSLQNLDVLIGCYNAVDVVHFPQLQEVVLSSLPLITSFIDSETEMLASGDNDASCCHPFFSHKEPDTVCRFPNLTSLKVQSCDRFRHISTPSMANCFGEVQKLEVVGCTGFQAVITTKCSNEGDDEDGGTQVVLFQKLNHLCLTGLYNLSTIVPKAYTLKWSSLKILDVSNSGFYVWIEKGIKHQVSLTSLQKIGIAGVGSLKLLSGLIPGGFSYEIRDMNVPGPYEVPFVFSPSLIRAYDHLEDITIGNLDSEVVFNLEEECSVVGEAGIAALTKLNSINIKGLFNMQHVWSKVPRNFEGFHNLSSVAVTFCNKLRYLLSPSMAKCLVKLRSVEISDCAGIEEIVSTADEEVEKEVQKRSIDVVFFPQLDYLRLSNLPYLRCINLAVSDSEKLSMEAPNAGSSQMLHQAVSAPSSSSISTPIWTESEKNNSTPLDSMETYGIRRSLSFLHLASIDLYSCHSLLTLFPPNVQVKLPVLERLSIRNCNELRYIFSCNPTLRSLRTLVIDDCEMLEVIVKDDFERGGRSMFVFPTLTRVYLELLPNLEGFCLGKSTFDWPSLARVEINDCHKMKIFTLGCSTTPLLDDLFRDSVQHYLPEGVMDINTTLRSSIEREINTTNTALREQGILTPTGFIRAGNHLIAQCSSWQWESRDGKHLIRYNDPCLERAIASSSTGPDLESECKTDIEDADNNNDDEDNIIPGPRKYIFIISYDDSLQSTSLWFRQCGGQDDGLPLDIHESYLQEYVGSRYKGLRYGTAVYLNPSENWSSFIKDLFARKIVQPDIENFFHVWLSAVVPSINFFNE